jgi:hypothetical protein
VSVNPFGDVVLGFSASSSGQYASAYAVVGKTYGPGNTVFGAPFLLQAGQATYQILDNTNANRWGDYSATNVDPNNPRHFWTIQEFASATNVWATKISEILVAAPGDTNCDGIINLADLTALATNYGASGPGVTWAMGDFDGDGNVNLADLTALATNYGVSYGAAPADMAPVPEPAILLLLAAGAVALRPARQSRAPRH